MRRLAPFARLALRAFVFTLFACARASAAIAPSEPGAAALRAQFERIHGEDPTAFGRPVHIVSHDVDNHLQGEVFALVKHPFAEVERGLNDAHEWCEVMMLPFNTTHCQVEASGGRTELTMFIAARKNATARDSYRVRFGYRVEAQGAEYMRITLAAAEGPFGTRDYHIALEAAPLDAERSIVHLSYAYAYGTLSRMAMQTYLATVGAPKVGFSVEGREDDGRPRLVHGMRGVIERNTMRYFLAIEAYLDTLAAPEGERLDRRLRAWFDATEQYPRQLHEMDRGEYLALKRREYGELSAML